MPSNTSSKHHIYGFMNYRKSIYESTERYDAVLEKVIYAQKQGISDDGQEKELRSLIAGLKQAESMKPLTAWRNILMIVLGALMLHQLFILAGWLPGPMISAVVFFMIYIFVFTLIRREVPWAYVVSGSLLILSLAQSIFISYNPEAGTFILLPTALYPYGIVAGLIANYKLYTERPMQAIAAEQAKKRRKENRATGNSAALQRAS